MLINDDNALIYDDRVLMKKGRPFEMPDQMGGMKAGPKMRPKNNSATPARPRPKTIHVDAGPADAFTPRSAMSSKGKRGSGTNLAENNRSDSRQGDVGVRGSNPTLSRRGSNSSLHGGKSRNLNKFSVKNVNFYGKCFFLMWR